MKNLLEPRYQVIANWPDSKYKIGDIIKAEEAELTEKYQKWLDSFPHLFRKMKWWESRELENMPSYIKGTKGVFKAEEWDVFATNPNSPPILGVRVKILPNESSVDVECYLPATEEEYNNYLNNRTLNLEVF